MHDLALPNLIKMVDEYVTEHGVTHAKQINLRLGEVTPITQGLIHACFEVFSVGTSCEGAILNIDEKPLSVFCEQCDALKAPSKRFSILCPDCGMPAHKVVTEHEIQLISIALFNADEEPRT